MPPSTILLLDDIVAVLRRSPATIEHQDRHHAVVLTELFPDTLLDRSPGSVIELNMCQNSEVPLIRCLIGRAVKTYDYINQVNASVVDLQGYVDHTLPLSLLCITMILRVRRKFFEITTFPNSGIKA